MRFAFAPYAAAAAGGIHATVRARAGGGAGTSRHGVLDVGRKRRSRIAPNDACIGAMRFAFAPYAAATTGGIQ